jgi:multiple sugar transport system ATP-binding protein
LRSRQLPKPERAVAVQQAAEMLGLGDLLDRKPAQLSGGQRQRVALARAVVRRPAAFLMDEPLSNLDATLRAQTRIELVELQRRLETTVIYVTHDQVEAMTMGHRVAVIDRGVLQQVGVPQDVYDRPANLFVARFIGTPPMNTLTADVVSDGGAGPKARLGDATVTLPAPVAEVVRSDGAPQIVLGVRPEHVAIGEPGFVPATVELVEQLGHERHVITRLSDGQEVVARQPSHGAAPDLGSTVPLSARTEHVHWFDATTGTRITT